MKEAVENFYRQISECARCFGKDEIVVPGPQAIDETPDILILGEQPSRETTLAGKRGIELDPSIERLRDFLEKAEIDESRVFYATSVLCIPKNETRRGPRPHHAETRKCTMHVQRLLDLLHPRLVIPLGHTSLQSLQWIFEDWRELRQFILNYDVGNVIEKNGLAVYPLLHPSVHTLRLRSQPRQMRDWKRISNILAGLTKTATK